MMLVGSITISALKMETICFSETLASADESTRRQNIIIIIINSAVQISNLTR
jgi:hypothetical protein